MTLAGIAIAVALTIAVALNVAAWSRAPQPHRTEPQTAIDGEGLLPVQASDLKILEEQLGIRILSLRLTSAGSQLDLRFRVTDVEKAAPLFDRDRPHMIHQASGVKLHAVPPPADSASQATRSEPEGRYAIVFSNPRRTVKHGDSVTILVGDCRVEHLVVFASIDPAVF
jgi:hypothetical protein